MTADPHRHLVPGVHVELESLVRVLAVHLLALGIELELVAAATTFESFENSIEPLLRILTPGCKKNGTDSNMVTILAIISLAIAPLLARTATVTSG